MTRTFRRWTARWIWNHEDGAESNRYLHFRTTVTLDRDGGPYTMFITASARYRLYVDGRHLHDGPPKSQPYATYYDAILLGTNAADADGGSSTHVIGVIVNHVGYDEDSRGGLLAEIVDANGVTVARTDETWRVLRSTAWRTDTYFVHFNRVVPYQEHVDARGLPDGWLDPSFDDSDWESATIVGWRGQEVPPRVAPWTMLVPRDIPFMTEAIVYPVAITEIGEVTATQNRMRSNDISISLSQPGRPLQYARVRNVEALLAATDAGDGSPAELACSTNHRSDPTAGINEPYVVLDFGRILNGFVELDVEGPSAAVVEIGYAERLTDGHFVNVIEGQFAESYTLRSGRQRWRPFAWKAFRYLKLRIRNAFEPVRFFGLPVSGTRYPYEERGGFASVDTKLNAVFAICRSTVDLCSNEYITDTPWREQGQWLGDVSAVTLGAIYSCYGDTSLAAKFLRQSAATQYPTGMLGNMTNTFSFGWQGVIPDFSLWWLIALREYYRYSGDEEIVRDLYYHAARLARAFLAYRNDSGLVEEMPYGVLIDWANVDRRGVCAPLNAILAGALDAMGELATLRGDGEMVAECADARQRIATAFIPTFWLESESLFCDAVVDGVPTGALSEHANAAAITFGLADARRVDAIVQRLWARGDNFLAGRNNGVTEAQPFFTSVVLKALALARRYDLGLALVRDRWGRRMVDAGATSVYEEWSRHGSWRRGDELSTMMRTESHAWSAFPARWLIEQLAGIEIVEPGCSAVRVRPAPLDFDCSVTFPTPRGDISVAWERGNVRVDMPVAIRRVE